MATGTADAYTGRAEAYDRHRWDYEPGAIEALLATTEDTSVVLDLGAGTGILAHHFMGRVDRVLALEPNADMRRILRRRFETQPCCQSLGASAERIPLRNGSVDLAVAAQAVHWFDAEPARLELARVLKPGGRLAFLRNRLADPGYERITHDLLADAFGPLSVDTGHPRRQPEAFYYQGPFERTRHPFSLRQDWEGFCGALRSASFVPGPDHPGFARFLQAARVAFDRLATDGCVTVACETELCLGHPRLP